MHEHACHIEVTLKEAEQIVPKIRRGGCTEEKDILEEIKTMA